jgi:hypothetical protein
MSNIDLRTCVPGQLLKDGRGNILEYKERIQVDQSSLDGLRYRHLLRYEIAKYDETFTDDGIFDINSSMSNWNIVKIFPLDEPEQPKSDKHPSVAWWESCPWITDRKPTKEDGNANGWVTTKLIDRSTVFTTYWLNVAAGQPWIHRQDWKKQTPKEKALALIASHEDGWIPTPEQWNIIREGLAE